MMHSLRDDRLPDLPFYDICIVGSGPAGLTICAELADTGMSICVLESGEEQKTPFADNLRHVSSKGIHVADDSRERVLGGTSQSWSGLCVLIDPIDLERRPFAYHTGWPISWSELYPYFEMTAERYRFPQPKDFIPNAPFAFEPVADPPLRLRRCEEKLFLMPHAVFRFGDEFRHLFERPKIDLLTDATVTELVSGRSAGGSELVEEGICRASTSKEMKIKAKVFVLAAGAIDNARILLSSRSSDTHSLGNAYDQVGRYLMNHPKGTVRVLKLHAPIDGLGYYSLRNYDKGTGYFGIRLCEDEQRKQGFLNCYVRLAPHFPWNRRREIAACRHALLQLKRCVSLRSLRSSASIRSFRELFLSAWAALRYFPALIGIAYIRLRSGPTPAIKAIDLFNFIEMAPDPANRVTLGSERNALGIPVPQLQHLPGNFDLRSLNGLHAELAREFNRFGLDAAIADDPPECISGDHEDAYHYLGTTRMGVDPAASVVDANLRVHSVDNLYVTGGSVFPTSGCANPTMTIVALSIRLARHLRETLSA